MKKVVIILTVMFMLTGCDKTSYNYQDEISKYTEEVIGKFTGADVAAHTY